MEASEPRPRDFLGPPTRAQYFGMPGYEPGRRTAVTAFWREKNANVKLRNVLLKDWRGNLDRLEAAYCPVQDKAPFERPLSFCARKQR